MPEFENDDERKDFENTFEKYKKMKKSIQETNDYFTQLSDELNTKGFVIIESKYQHLPNCRLFLSKLKIVGSTNLYINYLN